MCGSSFSSSYRNRLSFFSGLKLGSIIVGRHFLNLHINILLFLDMWLVKTDLEGFSVGWCYLHSILSRHLKRHLAGKINLPNGFDDMDDQQSKCCNRLNCTIIAEGLVMIADSSGLRDPWSCGGLKVWLEIMWTCNFQSLTFWTRNEHLA